MEKKTKPGAIQQLLDYAGDNKKQLYFSTFLATLGELFGMAPFIAVSLLVSGLFNKTATIQNVLILFVVALGGQVLKLWLTYQSSFMSHKPNASHTEVVEAAKRACCHDFIEALPQGYETMIGEAGSTLSGGEKQRISIARAILKDAPIVILDEATSSVDPENEKALLDAIFELTKNKTLISIAHRLSTVRTADQIIVIDQGHIAQRGTHKELLEEGIYRTFLECREKSISWKL